MINVAVEQNPIFVYGTLRQGQSNYKLLMQGRTQAEQPAYLYGARLFSMVSCPIAIEHDDIPNSLQPDIAPETPYLRGDLITVHPFHYDAMLQELDQFEEYYPYDPENSMYIREQREVILADQTRIVAWVYIGNPNFLAPSHEFIPSGDWVAYRQHRRLALQSIKIGGRCFNN